MLDDTCIADSIAPKRLMRLQELMALMASGRALREAVIASRPGCAVGEQGREKAYFRFAEQLFKPRRAELREQTQLARN